LAYFPSFRGPVQFLALIAFGWLALAPGIRALPPIDRDESRYAQASRQMLESGDFVRIRFQDEPRNKKPAGIYWLQAASAWLTGDFPGSEIWPYRLPSLLGALAALALTYGFGRSLFEPRTALLAAGLLGASLLMGAVARQAHTDAALLATAAAAQGALGSLYLARRRRETGPQAAVLTFWIAEGAAILIKGPVVPAVSLLTLLALSVADRDRGWWTALRPGTGVPIMLAIAAPWFIAISISGDGGFVADAVSRDLLPKLVSGQEGHGAPPGYYLLSMMLSFWPGSLFAVPALVHAWRRRGDPALRFALAWLAPAWIMFELVPTKLPSYVLPTFPALALITAHLVIAAASGAATPLDRRWPKAIGLLWLALALVLAATPAAIGMALGGGLDLPALGLGLFGAALALWVAHTAWRRRWMEAATVAILGSAVMLAADFGWILPAEEPLWLSRSAAASIARYNRSPDGSAAVASTGYTEPSLVFLVGTNVALVGPEEAARRLAAAPDRLALVRTDEDAAFRRAAERQAIAYRRLDSVRGFNYSKGQWVTLTLYGRAS
jgi:4-amino-4-deoxy-L-arabinose transferase-like glycosyltransferase